MKRVLRRAAIGLLACWLVLLCCVQFQMRRLQHRAERLHAEILALQLQPGSFADVQRLQREWGAFGNYKGTCTVHHCIYEIELRDFYLSALGWPMSKPSGPPWLERLAEMPWFLRSYRILGGRPARISANLRVRDDRMWGNDFGLALFAYPGDDRSAGPEFGRNAGHTYFVIADIDSGSRLGLGHEAFKIANLNRGFRTSYELRCLGCEYAIAAITPQTAREEIIRLNQFELGCISRMKTCRHPVDLAPALWQAAVSDAASSHGMEEDETQYCKAVLTLLVRESNDVIWADVLSVRRNDESTAPKTTVRVLKVLKNGRQTLPGTDLALFSESGPVYSANGEPLVEGKRYFFLYDQPQPGIPQSAQLQSCHAVPDTAAHEAEILEGLKLDPSAGEPYKYRNNEE